MAERIHLVLSRAEKERYRLLAARDGKSLSEWLRAAAEERATRAPVRKLDTREALEAFFAECDALHAGEGPELDWEEYRQIIDESLRSGDTGT